MEGIKNIKLFGNDYLLIGDTENPLSGLFGSAIATKEQFENFECSYAQLMPDGNIQRFGEVIGTKDDITYLEDDSE